MAWARLRTIRPLRPDFNRPRFISCIARSTLIAVFAEYFRCDRFRVTGSSFVRAAQQRVCHESEIRGSMRIQARKLQNRRRNSLRSIEEHSGADRNGCHLNATCLKEVRE